jgi:TRAP-type C4-dicarboxylate transport system substrate-binding protein
MKKGISILLLIILVSVLFLVGCAPAPALTSAPAQAKTSAPATSAAPQSQPAQQNVIELRFSHHNPPQGRTTVKFLNAWAKKAEDATKGKIKITMYPAESLAKSADNLQAVTGGVADMSWLTLSNWAGRFPLTEVMGLPFMGLDSGKVDGRTLSGAGINSHIIQQIYEETPEMQAEWSTVKVLFIHTGDMTFPCTSKKQIHGVSDAQGLKIRVNGKYPMSMWQALGASPLQIPMPDIYDAAQKGVIDGFSLPWSAIITAKLQEVFKYYSDLTTDHALFAVVINKDKWASLPKDVQDGILSVSGVTGAEFAGESGWGSDVRDEALAAIKAQNLDVQKIPIDAGEYNKFLAAGKNTWDKWVADVNAKNLPAQKVLDKATGLIAKYK